MKRHKEKFQKLPDVRPLDQRERPLSIRKGLIQHKTKGKDSIQADIEL